MYNNLLFSPSEFRVQGLTHTLGDDVFPNCGWETFPSRDIPENFNFGSVFHYLVETMPEYTGDECVVIDSDSEGDSDEDEDVTILAIVMDPFADGAISKEVLKYKKIRRGLMYLKSGFITGMQDCYPDRYHVYKAHVRASMEQSAYWVHVALSQMSGQVAKCTCECKQKSLGRCSHVGGVLLSILGHVRLNGYGGKLVLLHNNLYSFSVNLTSKFELSKGIVGFNR